MTKGSRLLLAIPNFSEGRDPVRLATLERALTGVEGVRLLDVHTDPDHNRSVYTLVEVDGAASSGLVDALLEGAAAAIELLDITTHQGVHPRIGTLDVVPIVYMNDSERGRACVQALTLSDRLGHELEIPVFLYGLLTDWRVTRAEIRRGGPQALQQRIDAGELTPDFGPRRLHPRAGAILVSARPPLVAFNVELARPATLQTAREIAALIRDGGPEGLPSVKAIGLTLPHRGYVAQVSTNVEDYRQTTLAMVVAAIARHATPLRAEIVGVPPEAAFDGFPESLPVANRRSLEQALQSALGSSGNTN